MSSTDPPKASSTSSYHKVLNTLLTHPFPVASLPTSPHKPYIPSHQISSLSLHPTLESALHILNLDLSSAHFLLRHMQAAPADEAMFLHGILHRIEGDYDNARAWYGDVSETEVFRETWPGGVDEGRGFIGEVEAWRKDRKGTEKQLAERSREEILRVLRFCERKFGTGEVKDASGVWISMSEKHADLAANMIMGGEGWREF